MGNICEETIQLIKQGKNYIFLNEKSQMQNHPYNCDTVKAFKC